MDFFSIFIRAIVVLTALPIHEFAHGYIAYKLGDPTAKYQGRLDLNPLKHLDPIGTIMILFTGFGFAKPVPVNPRYFKNRKLGMALTALAGPVANILLAAAILILSKIIFGFIPITSTFWYLLNLAFQIMILTNIQLAVFNLLPIPPLDGSKILGYFLSDRINYMMYQYQHVLSIALLVLLLTGVLSTPLSLITQLIYSVLNFATGFIDIITAII